jgi:NADH-quinone oxidoreductase subunit G
VLATAARIALAAGQGKEAGWNAFNVLNGAASRVAGLDLGFVPGEGGLDVAAMLAAAGKGQLDTLYLLGADEIDMSALGKAFVIYQGSHGDAGAQRADVVLPGSAYTEKSATYVNVEGRAQMASRAAFPPGDAKEDWAIVRALSAHIGHTLPYDSLPALRAAMYKEAPALARLDAVEPAGLSGVEALAARGGTLGSEPLGLAVRDFYLTNPIARASAVMAELSALAKSGQQGTTGTHG